jgi:hypothetical protein
MVLSSLSVSLLTFSLLFARSLQRRQLRFVKKQLLFALFVKKKTLVTFFA